MGFLRICHVREGLHPRIDQVWVFHPVCFWFQAQERFLLSQLLLLLLLQEIKKPSTETQALDISHWHKCLGFGNSAYLPPASIIKGKGTRFKSRAYKLKSEEANKPFSNKTTIYREEGGLAGKKRPSSTEKIKSKREKGYLGKGTRGRAQSSWLQGSSSFWVVSSFSIIES